MAWSNSATRTGMTVEKSRSLSFSVRVEDRLHTSIIQADDTCVFTVRPVNYSLELDDTSIVTGTPTVVGTGIVVPGVLTGTGEEARFLFQVQAAALNLDPELEYWYDITYTREGYSMSVSTGTFTVMANPASAPGLRTYTTDSNVFDIISSVDNRQLLTVTSTIPLPEKGDYGVGSYVIDVALSEVVGEMTDVPVAMLDVPLGRDPQIGDVIFSSVTRGVLGTLEEIDWDTVPSVQIMTRQVYSMEALKALLDINLKIVPTGETNTIEDVDHVWTIPTADVPLPVGYEYRVGDMVFSHSATAGFALTKKLLISLVTAVGVSSLTVQTKVVFPMFLNTTDIEDMLGSKADADLQVNGHTLTDDFTLDEGDIPATASYPKFTSAQQTKLTDLPTNAALSTALAGKAASGHTHQISDVANLQTGLDGKVDSTSLDNIWTGTQTQYDAISVKDTRTLYVIKAG